MNDRIFEFYKQSYYHEIDLNNKLHSRIQISLGIIIVFISYLIYMIQATKINIDSFLFGIQWVLFLVDLYLIIKAILFLKKAFYGLQYIYLPTLNEINNFKENLLKYYNNDHETVRKIFENELINYFVDYTSHNAKSNEYKTNYIHLTNKTLWDISILLFMTSLVFYINRI